RNLAAEPQYATILEQMRNELKRWEKETGDVRMKQLSPDEFDRETGDPLPNRVRPRPSKQQLMEAAKNLQPD
ncbi:MAG TPA: hypothetical protein VK968_14285, partial [Roseimicrobium sp.]|nr:hypothetical protein [Roseimicrobium sp.]